MTDIDLTPADYPRNPPKPTTKQPGQATLERWLFDGCCRATDGCMVEPDGWCSHGHLSWLDHLGLI